LWTIFICCEHGNEPVESINNRKAYRILVGETNGKGHMEDQEGAGLITLIWITGRFIMGMEVDGTGPLV
jgi:hypothetical protein